MTSISISKKNTPRDPAFEHAYAVIMAGGSGTRFWPLSRRKRPKQLLTLFGKSTLLEQTVARIRGLIPAERTYVLTNELLLDEVQRSLPGIPPEQVVAEPAARNTAPTIGLAAHEILRRDPDGLMVVLPSDHVIRKPGVFRRCLRAACQFGWTEGRSVVLGLKPTEPHTGYGYVRLGVLEDRLNGQEVFRVMRFTEKPPLATARRYVASGRYLWNGGMFIWRASTVLRNLEKYQPEMARGLAGIAAAGGIRSQKTLQRLYPRLQKISVDFALMEKISSVYAVAADIGWSDVGSWSVAYDLNRKDGHGNVRPRHTLCLDSQGNMIVSPRKYVVTVGVQRLIIVETDDALLVCAREHSQDVGRAVQELDGQGHDELL
jgi:mannose-1-phosphate guanylyltransferase